MLRVRRRDFLVQCGKVAGTSLIPAQLSGFLLRGWPEADYYFHPNYREQTPLDKAVLKLDLGDTAFASERYYSKLSPILDSWAKDLLGGLRTTANLAKALHPEFQGTPPNPIASNPSRPVTNGLSCHRLEFSPELSSRSENFLSQFQSQWSHFSQIHSADLQVTRVEATGDVVTTYVLYEIVGSGGGFFREQRVGEWILDWHVSSSTDSQVLRWRISTEVRSRTQQQAFVDITRVAFSSNHSYTEQMSHGADYWRTVLDASTGIDVYGHNGISVGDIDGDGFDDIYVCQPAGLPNRLYRNLRDGTFQDITDSAGVGVLDNTACALIADFNNDGHQDLLVVRANGPLLFLNQGNGKFKQKPDAFQFANPPQGTFTGASAADYDRDGRLDVYFCLYAYYQGTDQYKYPTPYFAAENGPPNFLMHNNGDGTFSDVTVQCGLDKNNTRYSFCSAWNDCNQSGWPDLYVVNDFGRKNLYRNNGDGTFTDIAGAVGVEDVGAGMSVSWLDYNNDGKQDLYVANMWTAAGERITNNQNFQDVAPDSVRDSYHKHAMGNSLLRDRGSDFEDVTQRSHTGRGRWAWSSDAWDFDHDGFCDIYVVNGMISGPIHKDLNSFFWTQVVANSPNTFKADADYELGWNAVNDLIRSDYSWSGYERNVLLANNRDGTFSDVSGALGLDFLDDARSFALADFDGDGRQEIIIKNRNAPQLRLIKNTFPDLPPAIAFRLQGTRINRDAIGATVTIHTSAGNQSRSIQAGSGFLSQHSKELFFGLGSASGNISATISWPSGLHQDLQNLTPNHRIYVIEGTDVYKSEKFGPPISANSYESAQISESLPRQVETWMLTPVRAPKFQSPTTHLVVFRSSSNTAYQGSWPDEKLSLTEILTDQPANEEISTVYSLLFRYLFDRHRDLPLPTSFLINQQGEIVKIYQGELNIQTVVADAAAIPATDTERLAKALLFASIEGSYQFSRNYLSLGSIFFQHGYPVYAEDFYQSALKQDPTSAEAAYGLGSVYLRQAKNILARSSFEKALKLTASYPETIPNAWNNLGLLATREARIEEAISCFKEAIQIDPGNFVALENLGNAYKQEKRWEEARIALESALTIKPKDAGANYSLGMVWAQLDNPSKAYDYLSRALESRPVYPEALNNLGILYLKTHRRDQAVATFEKCIQLSPDFEQSYLNLARIYAIEGAFDKARDVLNALLAKHPDNSAAKQALAQLP